MKSIQNFMNPRSITVIGATDREGTVGRSIIENLIVSKDKHKIYPINPTKKEILELKCYSSISALPETPDLAVIATPAATVPDIVEECGKAGIQSIIIISAGFKEVGPEGKLLENRVSESAKKYGIRILGPNCIGIIRPSTNLNATFTNKVPKPGDVTFLSQSGALGSAVLDWAVNKGIGFSTFVSLGSMLDLDFGDFIDFFGEDPETKSIIIYAESLGDSPERTRKFMSAARGFARSKPIIVLKPGKFQESAQAAKSHTGSMVGDDSYYNAAFSRAGVVRVDEIEDLFNCASILNTVNLPKGPNLAIVTNAGGPGVLATDTLIGGKGKLASLSKETIAALNKALPPSWSKGNPIDILGSALPEHYVKATEMALADPKVDCVVVISVPTGVASQTKIAKSLADFIKTSAHKPVLIAMMGEGEAAKARQLLLDKKIPSYTFPEDAIRTYLYMYQYARNLEQLYETPEDIPVEIGVPKQYLKLLVRNALAEGNTTLSEEDAKKFLSTYRIASTVPRLAKSPEDAISIASQTGYPVVMKIASPDISHKSDVGGVKLGLSSHDAVKKAFSEMMESVKKHKPDATIEGATIQRMVPDADYELIIGSKKDQAFGPIIMFGLGGTDAEFFKDIAVGLPPLNQTLAQRIMEQTKTFTSLQKGFRNKPPVDLKIINDILIKVSNMLVDFPEIKELDINPLAISNNAAIALDARIILDDTIKVNAGGEHDHLIISPYPTKYIHTWRCNDGTEVLIRPIRPEDEPKEYDLIAGLTPETMRQRFFHPIKTISHDMLTRFCNIDYDREMAFIAEETTGENRRILGVGRLVIPSGRTDGEFAILVTDSYQGKGLGLKLTDMIIGVAIEKDLKSIYAVTLNDNMRMLGLGRTVGFKQKHLDAGEVQLILKL